MRVRVAIADDQPLVRDGFRVQLGLAGDMAFAGEASTGEQAVALARRERPDVLLMDVQMPVLDGIAATRRLIASGLSPSAMSCAREATPCWAVASRATPASDRGMARSWRIPP